MVKEVQPDGFFEGIGDWFGDRGLGIKKFFGGLDIYKYLNDMDNYHRQMIDKDNVSATKINNIFIDAINVDTDYKNTFSGNCALINDFSALVKEFYSCIYVNNTTFCSSNSISEITQSELYSGYKKKYIENFEAAYPEYKDDMNKFFDPIKDEHQTDIDNIKFIVYSSEEPYRSLFLDNVGDAKWGKTAPYKVKRDGKTKTESGFAFYSPSDNTINIDLTDNSNLSSDPRGSYATFFHEYGHYLDDRYKIMGNYTDSYVSSDGKTISEKIDNDVYNVVKSKVKKMFPEYSDNKVEQITKRLVKGNLPGYVDNDDDSIKQDAIKVQSEFRNELASAKADGPSDTYDGSTNYLRDYEGKDVDLNSSETGKGVSGAYQHGDDYYYRNKNGKLIKQDNNASKESFATFFSVGIRSDSESRAYYEKYLPNTTKEFDIVFENM